MFLAFSLPYWCSQSKLEQTARLCTAVCMCLRSRRLSVNVPAEHKTASSLFYSSNICLCQRCSKVLNNDEQLQHLMLSVDSTAASRKWNVKTTNGLTLADTLTAIKYKLLPSPPLSERRRYCVARRLCVCVCVCVRQAATACRIGGEGNTLYPVLSNYYYY